MSTKINVESIDAEFEVDYDEESGSVKLSFFVDRAGGIRLTATLAPEDAAKLGLAMQWAATDADAAKNREFM